jgi:hypothetical protein
MQLSDVLIHIDQQINDLEKERLTNQLREVEGVIAPRFNDGKKHLLLVSYNPDSTNTMALLKEVENKGYTAQLIGL